MKGKNSKNIKKPRKSKKVVERFQILISLILINYLKIHNFKESLTLDKIPSTLEDIKK